jgi:hypothetical protein
MSRCPLARPIRLVLVLTEASGARITLSKRELLEFLQNNLRSTDHVAPCVPSEERAVHSPNPKCANHETLLEPKQPRVRLETTVFSQHNFRIVTRSRSKSKQVGRAMADE